MGKIQETEMKYIIFIPFLLLAGCNQVNSLGIEEGENAFACLQGQGNTNATLVNSQVRGVTLEMPANFDLSTWDSEQISAFISALCGEV